MKQFETLVDRTRQLGITVHTVVLQNPMVGSLVRSTSVAEALGSDLEPHTGGSLATVFRGSDLTAPLGAVVARIVMRSRELARQYVIRYERPDGADVAPGRRRVVINRFGIRYRVTVDGRLR